MFQNDILLDIPYQIQIQSYVCTIVFNKFKHCTIFFNLILTSFYFNPVQYFMKNILFSDSLNCSHLPSPFIELGNG